MKKKFVNDHLLTKNYKSTYSEQVKNMFINYFSFINALRTSNNTNNTKMMKS